MTRSASAVMLIDRSDPTLKTRPAQARDASIVGSTPATSRTSQKHRVCVPSP